MSRGPSLNEVWRERQNALRAAQEGSPAGHARRGYDPNQPRVPAGHSDGGQWTSTGRGFGIQLAAADKLPLPRRLRLLLELAMQAIKAYRSENWPPDLFGELRDKNTVTVTTIDGKDIFGSNSKSPTYKLVDEVAARKMRDILLVKYPELKTSANIGGMPYNALFHAETTVLLRAARDNGGTLGGRELVVISDAARLCNNCETVLPKIGLELGNPIVTFIDRKGTAKTMRNGEWD